MVGEKRACKETVSRIVLPRCLQKGTVLRVILAKGIDLKKDNTAYNMRQSGTIWGVEKLTCDYVPIYIRAT